MKKAYPPITEMLDSMTVNEDYSGNAGLKILAKIAQLDVGTNPKKGGLQKALLEFYQNRLDAKNVYLRLPDAQKALLSHVVWSGGQIDTDEFKELITTYKLERCTDRSSYYYYSTLRVQDYFPIDAPMWLLLPGGVLVREIAAPLLKYLGPPPRNEAQFLPPTDAVICERECKLRDFAALVRYCNQNRVTVTKGGLLSKGAAVGFWKDTRYQEITETLSDNASDARNLQKMRVGLPLYLTALALALLAVEGDKVVPGSKAAALLPLPPHRLVERLFKEYQSSTIREIDFMTGIREHRPKLHYPKAREAVAKKLGQFPAGRWLSAADFVRYIRMTNRNFLRAEAYSLCYTGNSGYLCGWHEAEAPFVYHMLSVYGAIGMLDLAWALREQPVPNPHEDLTEAQSVPVCFRITPLGAYLLGITDSYNAPESQTPPKLPGGFLIQPDFTLMLPESRSRLSHELYFERFLTRLSDDAQMCAYRLDADGIIRLLNLGMTVQSLREYLERGLEKPMPDNVIRAFEDWEEMSGKVRIRTVTILETDDPILLEEIVRYKGMDAYVRDRTAYAAVIDPEGAKKVKTILEKNKRYCKDVYMP